MQVFRFSRQRTVILVFRSSGIGENKQGHMYTGLHVFHMYILYSHFHSTLTAV